MTADQLDRLQAEIAAYHEAARRELTAVHEIAYQDHADSHGDELPPPPGAS